MRKTESQKIALCGMLGALSVVLLLLGSALQIGTYAAPMLAAVDEVDLSLLASPHEMAVAAKLGEYPEVIEAAARELAPHMVAFYLKDLAADFHSYYNAERMLVDDVALRNARMALSLAVRQVIRNGLAILGVSCPESM